MVNLTLLYKRLNQKYFNNMLPKYTRVKFEWMIAYQMVGQCWTHKRLIRISKPYHDIYPNELEDTMIHEMIHLIHPNHGKGFYKEMDRLRSLGATVSRHSEHDIREQFAKHVYKCPCCGNKVYTFRKLSGCGKRICPECKSLVLFVYNRKDVMV